MGNWKRWAAEIDKGLLSHPWARHLREGIREGCPKLFSELEQGGDLDDYLVVQVAEALEMVDLLISQGTPRTMAEEIAKSELIPEKDY